MGPVGGGGARPGHLERLCGVGGHDVAVEEELDAGEVLGDRHGGDDRDVVEQDLVLHGFGELHRSGLELHERGER